MYQHKKLFQRVGMALFMSFSSTAVLAGNIASEQLDSGGLTLSPAVSYDSATLRVSSDNSDTTNSYAVGESISVNAGNLVDGVYSYELSLVTDTSESDPNGSAVHQSGGFKVQGGIASSNSDEEQNAEAEAEAVAVEALARANASAVNSAED